MKALSLTQPWASLVALGHKRVETRSWRTSYCGPIAIHAALAFPPKARLFAETERALGRLPARIPRGAIVAIGILDHCSRVEECFDLSGLERLLGDYTSGRWAWFLRDVHALTNPVPARGHLSLWTMPPELVEAVRREVS